MTAFRLILVCEFGLHARFCHRSRNRQDQKNARMDPVLWMRAPHASTILAEDLELQDCLPNAYVWQALESATLKRRGGLGAAPRIRRASSEALRGVLDIYQTFFA